MNPTNQMNRMHSHDQIKLISPDMRKSTSLQQIGHSFVYMDNLVGILKCAICNGQVKQAHMCPTCCKLFCEMCIKNYIVYKKAECPCCAKPLRYTSPINCQALAKQIQNAISKTVTQMSSDIKSQSSYQSKMFSSQYSTPDLNSQSSRISYVNNLNLCPEHQLKMQYYCETCLVGVCSDCAVLSNNHQGHKLCRYSQKRQKFQEKVAILIKNITNIKVQFAKKKQQRMQNIQNMSRFQRQKKQVLTNYLKKSSDTTFIKLNQSIQFKTQQLNKQHQQTQQLNELFKRYQANLSTNKKVQLIKKSQIYRKQVQYVVYNKLKVTKNVKLGLQNQLCPIYGSKTFILDNYAQLKQKGDILYSQPLFWKGIQWKLRIFPGGSQDQAMSNQNQKFLAIYLQMAKGHHQSNIYKYQILLINQVDRSKAIGCTFQNQFEQGTYWGLDRFANISFLFTEKFIHPTHGYLQIVLNVKSPSYYHIVKDQNFFINQKQLILKQRNKYLRTLRKKAGKNAMNVVKGNRMSLIVKALVENSGKVKKIYKRTMSNPKF